MRTLISVVVVFCLVPALSFGQTRKAYEKAAAKYMAAHDYFGAMRNYQKAAAIDSTKLPNVLGAADAARLFTAYSIAEKYYEQALALDTTFSTDAMFWLAYVENSQGKYDEAKSHYQAWMTHRQPSHPLYEQAALYIQHTDWAKANPVFDEKVKIRNLGDNINSPESDFAPARLGDELYFSSLRFLYEKDKARPKRYFSKLMVAKDGEPAQKLDAPFNLAPDKHISNLSFNQDGSAGYFTICDYQKDGSIKCQIYFAERQPDGSWSTATRLSNTINSENYNTTQPMVAVSDEGTFLYFASNRPGGKGGMDIWRAKLNGNNEPGTPENLADINTPLDEVTPYFDAMTNTLYFSSNGHPGYGQFDIFKSERTGDHWGEVVNLKKPINSSYNDVYFSLRQNGTKGYLASNRPSSVYIDPETETCCNDIYDLDIPVKIRLIVTTLNKLSHEVLNGTKVQVKNLTDGTIDTVALLTDGHRYFFELDPDKEYEITGMKNGYKGDTVLVSTMGIRTSKVIEKELLLEPKLELVALTFDKITHTPLPKAGVRLIDLTDNSKEQKVNDESNEFDFALEYGRDYMLIGYRDGFTTDTVRFTTKGIPFESKKITKKLFLEKDEGIYAVLPVYFHNDEPNPNTTQEYATVNYETAYRHYSSLKDEYIRRYSEGFPVAERDAAKAEVERFFDQEVVKGYESLKRFADRLEKYMSHNKDAIIVIKGYASPLAPEQYNYNLTKRRIDSVEKFLKELNGGRLRKYFDSGRIKVQVKPYGEAKADPTVSDSPTNRRESVYNPKAARERRVEILQLKSLPNKAL